MIIKNKIRDCIVWRYVKYVESEQTWLDKIEFSLFRTKFFFNLKLMKTLICNKYNLAIVNNSSNCQDEFTVLFLAESYLIVSRFKNIDPAKQFSTH